MNKGTKILAGFLTSIFIFVICNENNNTFSQEIKEPTEVILAQTEPIAISICEPTIFVTESIVEEPTAKRELISQEDLELLALLTMAEAEGEPKDGQRLVIDTVLNRVDSEHFPDTIYDVIWQKNQFTPMWNGRIDRCEVKEDICQLILEELDSRSNYDVIFFNAYHYSTYGVPMFQKGSHYFSSYDLKE